MALVLRPPVERESLPVQLADIGRARKRFAVAAGAFALVAVGVGIATVAGFLDAAVHLGPLPRAVLLVALLVATGTVWFRGVVRPLWLRTDALAVALELENRFPNLNDALASAVDFLGPDPDGDEPARPRAMSGVSNRLTASAVRAAERKAVRLPLDQIVPAGKCWRAVWAGLVVMAVAVPLALWDTARAATALVRLADPFGAHPWPTKTQIRILAPEQFPVRVSKGEPFELRFAVRGVLPETATVRVRADSGGESEEQYRLSADNDPKYRGAAVVTVRFPPARVTGNFAVRVTANDAETDWQDVVVVPPPRLVPLDDRPSPQFHATRPAYTLLPPVQLPDGAAVIEVPTGTVLRFRAKTDVKLSAATLSFAGDRFAVSAVAPLAHLGYTNPLAAVAAQGLADAVGADVPLDLSEDGTVLAAEFVPPLSGPYALKLTDDTGLTGTLFIEIRLTPDPVPVVTLARPLAGFDPPLLAPTASVLVSATAEDKLYAVRQAFLEYRVGRDSPTRTLPLARALNVSPPPLAAVVGGAAVAHLPPPTAVEVTRSIPVSAFLRDDGTPVREGDLLIIRAAADDWDNVAVLKGYGRSIAEVEIRIASPEMIEGYLQKELASLRPELVRVREQQRDAKQKVADVVLQAGGAVSPGDRDKLVAAEQVQRQVRGKIGDARDGMRAKADLLRATVRANDLPESNTTRRVERVAFELDRTEKRDLDTIEQSLAEARQLAGPALPAAQQQQLADALRTTTRHQKAVEDTATDLLDLLSQWGGAGEIRGEARVLRDAILRQLAANEHLKDRVPEGKPKPTADEQRELERAAGKVEQAAEQAGVLVGRATKLAAEKDKQAADFRAQAAVKEAAATALRVRAAETTNPLDKSALTANAAAAAATAADLTEAAAKAAAEAAALRKGVKAAEGQALADDLRQAADSLRWNKQSGAADLMRTAVKRLDALAAALTETEPEAVPELAKRTKSLKGAADQLDALAAAQDDLRKKVEAAGRIPDAEKRQAALKELAKEQEQLIERGRELLQKLTRDKADGAARDTRTALDRMETARDDLEKGRPAGRSQAEAVDKLDTARDALDTAADRAGRQLSDEKRRKLADQVKALLEQQRAAVAEARRIHAEVAKAKRWNSALLSSYSELDEIREKAIARDVRKLAENEFAPLPVFARLLTDAATAAATAGDRIKARGDDADPDLAVAFDPELEEANDRKVMRPMELALNRLIQLSDALKPDEPKKRPNKADAPPPAPPAGQTPPNPNGGGERDVVPPLAQLKVLRALQEELNKNTAEFARNHPDADKLTDEDKAELKELERAQREIAELFGQVAKLFDKQGTPGAPPPEEPKDGQPRKDPKEMPPAPEKP